jgi:hypothetical protein
VGVDHLRRFWGVYCMRVRLYSQSVSSVYKIYVLRVNGLFILFNSRY